MRRLVTTPAGRAFGSLAAVVFVGWWSITLFRGRWAVRIPDERHTYGIRVHGGVDLFFPPQLGWFVDHALWIVLALLAMTIVAEYATRRRQEFQGGCLGNDHR
jgi:hypothetical protein